MKPSRLAFGRAVSLAHICSLLFSNICDWRLAVSAIAALMMVPSVVVAQTTSGGLPEARSSSGDSLQGRLVSRGLVGSDLAVNRAMIAPPSGTEVDETEQIAKQDGQTISQTRAWTEESTNYALHIELTTFPSRQS